MAKGNARVMACGTMNRIRTASNQRASTLHRKGMMSNAVAGSVNRAILLATRFVTLAGEVVLAICGLDTITAQMTAARPRTDVQARREGGASCHSRCQSAI